MEVSKVTQCLAHAVYPLVHVPVYIYVCLFQLFDRIVQKSFYNEKEARSLCRILLDSIKFCHDRDVVHRYDISTQSTLCHVFPGHVHVAFR